MMKMFGILALCATLGLASCKKGCNDPDSINYKSETEEECRYQGKVIFWIDEATSKKLAEEKTDPIIIHLNEEVYKQLDPKIFYNAAPDCNVAGAITKDLGNVKKTSFPYKVYNKWGRVLWEGTVELQGNKCTNVKLTK